MTQHSVAPWRESPTANPDAEFCIADANGTVICRFDHWRGGAESEQDANARLIAAAPQMLEALQAVIKASDEFDDGSPDCEEITLAKAAIAAATNP